MRIAAILALIAAPAWGMNYLPPAPEIACSGPLWQICLGQAQDAEDRCHEDQAECLATCSGQSCLICPVSCEFVYQEFVEDVCSQMSGCGPSPVCWSPRSDIESEVSS